MDFQKAAVTGATGHLGNVLVRELVRRGKQARALVLPGEDAGGLDGLPVEIVRGDVCRPETLGAAFAGQDVVFHLAGMVSIHPGDRPALERVNVGGTRNVIAAARAAAVKRLVYTSSVHAFTEPEEGGLLDERSGFDPVRAHGDYGWSKATASLEVLRAAREGLDSVLVCPTGCVGPYDFRRSEVGRTISDFATGKLGAIVSGGYDWVDVRDVAVGHVLACERGRAGEAYLLSGQWVRVVDMLKGLSAAVGRRLPRVVLPVSVAKAVAAMIAPGCRLFRLRPRLTPYAMHQLDMRFRIDGRKAREELGFSPRPVEVSVRDAWEWFEAEGARARRCR